MALNIDLSEYDLISIDSVSKVESKLEETLYDIKVDGNHTFYITLPSANEQILAHNCDGSHITAMLIGWFKRFAPNLFNEGKVCKLVTPLIIIEDKNGKILNYFMSVAEFKTWEAKNQNNKNKIVYLKGLGSWEKDQLVDLIKNNGLEKFVVEYHLDHDGEVYIEDWLGNDAEKRKAYLREYTFDINQA